MSRSKTTDSLVEAVDAFIKRRRLIAPRATIVAAVSGGADSVAMLAVLRELAGRHKWRLVAAHLNHALRPQADQDAQFVARLARRWRLPCAIEKADVAGFARDTGQGIELSGRQLRYEFLHRQAIAHRARYVAVAHHADDNVETVIHRIMRGTHLRGLAGIPASRALAGSDRPAAGDARSARREVLLVRPMLEVRRREIENFCRRRGLSWLTDASNADIKFQRNFIRHELLPLIRAEVNSDVDQAILNLAAAAGEAEECLVGLAGQALRQAIVHQDATEMVLRPAALRAAEPIVRTTALRLAMERMGVPMQAVGREHLQGAADVLDSSGPAGLSLPGGWRFERRRGCVALCRPTTPTPDVETQEIVLDGDGLTVLPDGTEVRCRAMPFDARRFGRHVRRHPQGREFLEADKIAGPLTCRRRRRGDGFHPLGSPGRQSVSDFLTNLKLPAQRRRQVWCICDQRGICCLAPLRIDQRVKVGDKTRRMLCIEVTIPP